MHSTSLPGLKKILKDSQSSVFLCNKMTQNRKLASHKNDTGSLLIVKIKMNENPYKKLLKNDSQSTSLINKK